jgi:pimeloyl-ACP methyl ester carboxylesterase
MEELTFNIKPDIRICVRITKPSGTRAGSPINGKPLLVFLHYWGGSSSTWHKLTSPGSSTCVSEEYPNATFDLRGWGNSTGPQIDDGNSYSVTRMAEDVLYVLSELSKSADHHSLLSYGIVLVGHSMGAKVALAILGLSMSRGGPSSALFEGMRGGLGLRGPRPSKILGLILLAPAPPTSLDLPPDMKAQQQVAYESKDSVLYTLLNVLAKPANLTESDIEMVVRDSLAGDPLAKEAWPSYAMQEDLSELLKRGFNDAPWKAPWLRPPRVCVIVGNEDVVEPLDRVESKVISFLQENGLGVVTTVAKGVKHLLPLEAPEIIAEEIRRF